MKVISFNANGIRSAEKKGFWQWFDRTDCDVLCVQELKAQQADLSQEILQKAGYVMYASYAQKRGYSGCAVWSRYEPHSVQIGLDDQEFDEEGRYVSIHFKDVSIASVYFPSGTSGDDRQEAKYRFLDRFEERMIAMRQSGREWILCGDMNIAHKEIDIKNWKGNLNHTGFLPQERAWMSHVFDDLGWVDVFRQLDERPDRYTWWSQRGQARAKNVGWRIDYQISTPLIAKRALSTDIYSEEKFSDHAPLIMEYDWSLKCV